VNFNDDSLSAQCNYWGPHDPTEKLGGPIIYLPKLTADPHGSSVAPQGEEQKKETLPGAFRLAYNFPNPFNPTTTIAYEVPPPGSRVTVVIYNVAGQVVRKLEDTYRPPGRYRIPWDGRNRQGEMAASGIYFVRMQAGAFVDVKKLTLLK
jgi:hypothetical protein